MKNILKMAIVSLLLIACTQDDVILENQNTIRNDEIEKTNRLSMLHFKSQDELKEFITHKLESKKDLLEEARTSFEQEGRISLLLVYNSLEKKEAEKLGLKREDIAIVDSPDSMLLLLLNERGEIQIENNIHRIDGEFVFTYTPGSEAKINEFLTAFSEGKIKVAAGETISFGKNLTIFKHTNSGNNEKTAAKSSRVTENIIEFNGRKARMIARQWNGHWAFYSSIGSVTKTQEWSRVLWWSQWKDAKTDNRLEFEMTYTKKEAFSSPLAFGKKSHNYCNCYEAIDIYDWSAGIIPAVFTPRDGVSKHWSHWYPATPNTVGVWLYY